MDSSDYRMSPCCMPGTGLRLLCERLRGKQVYRPILQTKKLRLEEMKGLAQIPQ